MEWVTKWCQSSNTCAVYLFPMYFDASWAYLFQTKTFLTTNTVNDWDDRGSKLNTLHRSYTLDQVDYTIKTIPKYIDVVLTLLTPMTLGRRRSFQIWNDPHWPKRLLTGSVTTLRTLTQTSVSGPKLSGLWHIHVRILDPKIVRICTDIIPRSQIFVRTLTQTS
jgi:hypothetical protein